MSTPLPISFSASPLPPTFSGTPQQLLDAFVARLTISTDTSLSLFVSGSIAPVYDAGPWLKNGTTWYVWDVSTGAYIPEILESESLQYIAQQQAPDPSIYTFWIALDANGTPINVQYYSGSQWADIYATQIQALSSSLANSVYTSYPAQVYTSTNQILAMNGILAVINYNTVISDPYSLYNPNTFSYTAPVAGMYFAAASIQIDNISSSDSCEFRINLAANGYNFPYSCWGGANGTNPPGLRWYPQFSGLCHLNAGDIVTCEILGTDVDSYGHTGIGTVNLSNGNISIFLVRPDAQQAQPPSATGTFTLVSGAATVSNTRITANSVIDFTVYSTSGSITQQPYAVTKTAGVGFTVHAGAGDNSTYNYIITN